MKFEDLHGMVPYARFGKVKSLTMTPYKGITLALPGRHSEDCTPKGGDFVVMVSDTNKNWKRHQFTHDDIFQDIEEKVESDSDLTKTLLSHYIDVVANGADPESFNLDGLDRLPGVSPIVFLRAVQCLAVAEHRRYSQYEEKFGGRYLPLRFACGIVEGNWSAADAISKQRRGRPGVEWLEKDFGRPLTTKGFMN